MCYIILYCIVLYCIILYYIVLYCIILYYIVLHYIILYCIILYCCVLYCIILYYIILYYIILYELWLYFWKTTLLSKLSTLWFNWKVTDICDKFAGWRKFKELHSYAQYTRRFSFHAFFCWVLSLKQLHSLILSLPITLS